MIAGAKELNFREFKFALFKMSQREAIIYLHCVGKTNRKIVKLLKAPKLTVCDTVNHYKKLGTSDDQPKCGHSQTSCTPFKIKEF